MTKPIILNDTKNAVEKLLSHFPLNLRLAAPLGIGKPNEFLNLLYDKFKESSHRHLTIYTALSLNPPSTKSLLGKRFLNPFKKRYWGSDYPDLEYAKDSRAERLPSNVTVHEFYLLAGSSLYATGLQRNYQSINYTHVAKSVLSKGLDVAVQLVAKDPETGRYSLSSNPDVSLDIADLSKKQNKSIFLVGVVHPDLPFLGGDTVVPSDFFDMIVEDPKTQHKIFATPSQIISDADHAIGFYASQMIVDGGTLQIGIGSLSDAIVSSLLLRQKQPDLYQSICEQAKKHSPCDDSLQLQHSCFQKGIYGLSEMVSDGYMHLHRAGILKRHVTDEFTGTPTYLHGAFYLGSRSFYDWLKSLKGNDFTGLNMTRVSRINDLYDANENVLREQRQHPRFLNTCMQVSLLGGVASETLENGRVISGVGGQYNFVAMSHELDNSRSILMLRSTRESKGKRISNIVWSLANQTIPRHLRDVVITEYGIADLKGKTDEETICALLNIADSQFQNELLEIAKKNGKVDSKYEIPVIYQNNTPQKVQSLLATGKSQGAFHPFALGSDFTKEEQNLAIALEKLQALMSDQRLSAKWTQLQWLIKGWLQSTKSFEPELERMELAKTKSFKEKIMRCFLLAALGHAP